MDGGLVAKGVVEGGVEARKGVLVVADADMGVGEGCGGGGAQVSEVAAPADGVCPVLADLRRQAAAGGPAAAHIFALIDAQIASESAGGGE